MRYTAAMQNVIVALAIAAALFGGYWYFAGGVKDTTGHVEAERQAAQFSSDFFGQAPAGTQPQAQTAGAAAATQNQVTNTTSNNKDVKKYMNAILHTNMGDIEITFMDTDAPNTVANFTKLAGEAFYDGTKFHRVIKGFMIQGGDPLSKDDAMQSRWGTGGPGYQFADEIHTNNKNTVGTIAMANSGPDTNGSQFFINVADNNFLDPKHTVFGKVTKGMDIIEKIQNTATGAGDRPQTPMVIESITLK